jgi:hypothetical protein
VAKAVVVRSAGKKPLKFSRGGLHRTTHTPAGEKIPASKISAAAAGKFGPKGKKQVAFMRNVLTGPK